MVEAILKGLALGVVLALSVGPIIFTIIKQSITVGHTKADLVLLPAFG